MGIPFPPHERANALREEGLGSVFKSIYRIYLCHIINRTFQNSTFNDIVERATKALSEEGFGVLTEFDVRATLRSKLDIDTSDHLILGACKPKMAHKTMAIEPCVAAM